jgi:hydroxymethylbilane synthase
MKVRIGTRGSDLALWQANHVKGRLEAAGCTVEIVVLQTRGDRIDDIPLHQIEGKAFFTAEIETALLEGRVDLAVHSHKDLPAEGPPGLTLVAIPERANVGERLLIAAGAHDETAALLPLRHGSKVGTSAPRRSEQLQVLRPDLEVLPLRGNVPTRVRRLREGRYDAVVLASAGLDRLALDTSDLVDHALPPELLVPAPAQGALAIQARAEEPELAQLCRRVLHDRAVAEAVAAERTLLVQAGGGCNLPLGCSVARDADGAWRARTFLGADHPAPGAAPRWATGRGGDPDAAVARAWEKLVPGSPTADGPLAGRRVAITGAAATTRLGTRLAVLGAAVEHERVLAFETVEGPSVAERVAALGAGDALAVTSKEAARRLAGVRVPDGVLVGAVGSATERELTRSGLAVDHVGDGGARELARSLPVEAGRRVLFPCALDALPDLPETLGERGVDVERLVLYRTVPCPDVALDADVEARVYMSPSAVAACLEHECALGDRAPARIALGPTTAAALERHGLSFRTSDARSPEAVVQLLTHAPPEEVTP